jgi:hypothetical protein
MISQFFRYLAARRRRDFARAILAEPFREGTGMERRLAWAISHREPLALTPGEHQRLRAVSVRRGFDGIMFGQLATFEGIRIVVDAAEAERQERASRTVTDHGGYPMGILQENRHREG